MEGEGLGYGAGEARTRLHKAAIGRYGRSIFGAKRWSNVGVVSVEVMLLRILAKEDLRRNRLEYFERRRLKRSGSG